MLYLISYDLHRHRDYDQLYEMMESWNAARLLESLWLAELLGPAEAVQDLVSDALDGDDSVAVIELDPMAQWATMRCQDAGVAWLQRHIPFRR